MVAEQTRSAQSSSRLDVARLSWLTHCCKNHVDIGRHVFGSSDMGGGSPLHKGGNKGNFTITEALLSSTFPEIWGTRRVLSWLWNTKSALYPSLGSLRGHGNVHVFMDLEKPCNSVPQVALWGELHEYRTGGMLLSLVLKLRAWWTLVSNTFLFWPKQQQLITHWFT